MRQLLLAAATVLLVAAVPAIAAPCKDTKTGKFIKCPSKAAAKPVRCKDAKGKSLNAAPSEQKWSDL